MLDAVPAGTGPSPSTGESFNCIAWVENAMMALRDQGFITLQTSFPDIRSELEEEAEPAKADVELRVALAEVQN